jgi:hypothetical protein
LQIPINQTFALQTTSTTTTTKTTVFNTNNQEYKNLPRLLGRATVKLIFKKPGTNKNRINKSVNINNNENSEKTSEVIIVVDGINHPYTAGNFIDLCLKKFYDNLPIENKKLVFEDDNTDNENKKKIIDNKKKNNDEKNEFLEKSSIDVTILGNYEKGYYFIVIICIIIIIIIIIIVMIIIIIILIMIMIIVVIVVVVFVVVVV